MRSITTSKRLRRALPAMRRNTSSPLLLTTALVTAALVAAAAVNRHLAKSAERSNPPAGRSIEVNGVRLHYIERGQGEPVVLLHGNGSMIQDFAASGLIDLVAKSYRVIVFDRPGFGYSDRPRGTVWTPDAQADLIQAALIELGVSNTILLGHSWGASVAVATALKYPKLVRGLVLASGYYYPTARLDVLAMGMSALPIIGDIWNHTISPLVSRLAWPLLLEKVFGPKSVPEKFKAFPKDMAVRPSQLRASAAEAAMMVPDAFVMSGHYQDLKMPVVIVAGEQDMLIDTEAQSARLHSEIPQSRFHRLPDDGHMIQQTATAEVMAAIYEAADASTRSAAAE